mmetsp:Transcript_30970/g.47242  ORF Transcript_30970/g.47242 Transcript_30970/m.47242 type:complete len:179 (+) Transcript_30970:41-577(+)
MLTTTTTRLSISNLYKRCMQSVKRIPSENHRLTYLVYIRGAFRSTTSPYTLTERMKDAEEQLKRMNYYHSLRDQNKKQPSPSTTNVTIKDRPSQTDLIETGETPSNETAIMNDWILKAVPFLNTKDVRLYAQHLIKDGFDSVEIVEQELAPDDLDFMKKAHKRALVRYLKGREDQAAS